MEPVIKDEEEQTDTDQEGQTDTTDGEDGAITPSQSRSPSVHPDEEEVDVGEMASSVPRRASGSDTDHAAAAAAADRLSPPQSERLSVVPEDDPDIEEDLVAMSKSLPALEISPGARHGRWPSMGGPAPERPSLDWIDSAESPRPHTVIVEVRILICLPCIGYIWAFN